MDFGDSDTHILFAFVIKKSIQPMFLLPLFLGWSVVTTPPVQVRTYHVSDEVCAKVRPYFHESGFLSWSGGFDCADVHTAVRRAFDAWQYNSHLVFRQVADRNQSDVFLDATSLRNDNQTFVGMQIGMNIQVDDSTCWYTDHGFCHDLLRSQILLVPILFVVWLVGFGCVFYFVSRPVRPFQSTSRLVSWTVVVAVPLVFFAGMLPCLRCHAFDNVVIHEVGHLLGFLHSDDTSVVQYCGCGNATAVCTPTTESHSAMHSTVDVRPNNCLARDDVDAVRSRYGGLCDDPVWCYEVPRTGYARVAVGLVYAFLFSWLVVAVRNHHATRTFVHHVTHHPQALVRRMRV
jgi:hypothetical protein